MVSERFFFFLFTFFNLFFFSCFFCWHFLFWGEDLIVTRSATASCGMSLFSCCVFFFFFFKTVKFMVGPMSCEQRGSRHTWLAVYVVPPLRGLMRNNTKCLMLGFHWALLSIRRVLRPIGQERRLLFSFGTALEPRPPPPSPSPVQTLPSPPSHSSSSSSVVPSNGMIAVADICCLSWWSCVKGEGNGNKGKGVGGRCGEGKTEWRQRDRLEGWRGQREGNRLERAAESRFGYRWSRNSVTSTVHLSCRGFFVKPIMSRVPSSAP